MGAVFSLYEPLGSDSGIDSGDGDDDLLDLDQSNQLFKPISFLAKRDWTIADLSAFLPTPDALYRGPDGSVMALLVQYLCVHLSKYDKAQNQEKVRLVRSSFDLVVDFLKGLDEETLYLLLTHAGQCKPSKNNGYRGESLLLAFSFQTGHSYLEQLLSVSPDVTKLVTFADLQQTHPSGKDQGKTVFWQLAQTPIGQKGLLGLYQANPESWLTSPNRLESLFWAPDSTKRDNAIATHKYHDVSAFWALCCLSSKEQGNNKYYGHKLLKAWFGAKPHLVASIGLTQIIKKPHSESEAAQSGKAKVSSLLATENGGQVLFMLIKHVLCYDSKGHETLLKLLGHEKVSSKHKDSIKDQLAGMLYVMPAKEDPHAGVSIFKRLLETEAGIDVLIDVLGLNLKKDAPEYQPGLFGVNRVKGDVIKRMPVAVLVGSPHVNTQKGQAFVKMLEPYHAQLEEHQSGEQERVSTLIPMPTLTPIFSDADSCV